MLRKDQPIDVIIDIYHTHIISDIEGIDEIATIFDRMLGLTEICAGEQTPGSLTMGGVLEAVEVVESGASVDDGQVFLDKDLLLHQKKAVCFIQEREKTPLWKLSHERIPLSGAAPPDCKQKELYYDRFSKQTRAGPPPSSYGAAITIPMGGGKTRVIIEAVSQESKLRRAHSDSDGGGGSGGGGGGAADAVDIMKTLYVVYVRIIHALTAVVLVRAACCML